jgi:hypothetical protein
MNIIRVIARLWGEPLDERRRTPGHFARLAPHPWSRQAVLCERMTERRRGAAAPVGTPRPVRPHP